MICWTFFIGNNNFISFTDKNLALILSKTRKELQRDREGNLYSHVLYFTIHDASWNSMFEYSAIEVLLL